MTARVVDRLETVQVTHQEAEGAFAATRALDLLLERDAELLAADQAGQMIDSPQSFDRAPQATLSTGEDPGQIGEHEDRSRVEGDVEQVRSREGRPIRVEP